MLKGFTSFVAPRHQWSQYLIFQYIVACRLPMDHISWLTLAQVCHLFNAMSLYMLMLTHCYMDPQEQTSNHKRLFSFRQCTENIVCKMTFNWNWTRCIIKHDQQLSVAVIECHHSVIVGLANKLMMNIHVIVCYSRLPLWMPCGTLTSRTSAGTVMTSHIKHKSNINLVKPAAK